VPASRVAHADLFDEKAKEDNDSNDTMYTNNPKGLGNSDMNISKDEDSKS